MGVSNFMPNHLPDHFVGIERIERPLQVVGTDFASRIKGKAYITFYSCSLAKATYLELTTIGETEKFIPTLKRPITGKGGPGKIYSDKIIVLRNLD